MKIDLTGKKAVITGSTGGIGFACAQVLAEAGADVVVNGRSDETVNRALEKLRSSYPDREFTGVAASLDTAEGPARIIEAAPSCDILVNNAAVNIIANVFEQPDDDYFKLFEINFLAEVRLTRHYMPGMLEKNWGRVLFHNSEQALRPSSEMPAYGATKAASLALARSVAEYTKGSAVTVNTVVIGPTRSDVTSQLHKDIAESAGITVEQVETDFFKNYRPASLLQRLVEGREVANMVAYLCSDYASATNGSVASVEGGVREVNF